MSEAARQRVASALIAGGAGGLVASMFLTWSETGIGPGAPIGFGALGRVPRALPEHNGWQTYSLAGAALAALAAALLVSAVVRRRDVRVVLALLTLAGLGFVIDAIASPPTLVEMSKVGPAWVLTFGTGSGPGEAFATAALTVGLIGLGLGVRASPPPAHGSPQVIASPAA
jgi:hypothetical protein